MTTTCGCDETSSGACYHAHFEQAMRRERVLAVLLSLIIWGSACVCVCFVCASVCGRGVVCGGVWVCGCVCVCVNLLKYVLQITV